MKTSLPLYAWIETFEGSVVVCDTEGTILAMNTTALKLFEDEGGSSLIGSNVLDCHPEPARTKLEALLQTRQKNVYTIEKNGVKKLIYQTPWYNEEGSYCGFLEITLPLPAELPHFIRT